MGCYYNFPESHKRQVRIQFVGDIMCHSSQIFGFRDDIVGKQLSSKSFEFVKPLLREADFNFGNLETTIVADPADYSGYPRFGSPEGFVRGIKDAGFDILSTANNHSADKGYHGIENTIKSVIQNQMIPVGTYLDEQDYENRKYLIIEKNDIRIGILNYTYSTNGIKVQKPGIVRVFQPDLLKKEMDGIQRESLDFLIVWFHFGTEYQITPNESQKIWSKLAFDYGADIVIGGHPHVVQEWKRFLDPKTGQTKLVAYSLGNFLSAQNFLGTDGGLMFRIALEKNGNNKEIGEVHLEPVWVYPKGYQIIPIRSYLNGELEYNLGQQWGKKLKNYKQFLEETVPLDF